MEKEILTGAALKRMLRSSAIKARNSLAEEDRIKKSAEICKIISALSEFQDAANIMIYKWTRGEVKLDELEEGGMFYDSRKIFLYPLCIDEGNMLAIRPGKGEGAWGRGTFGIKEPVMEKGEAVAPHRIDMILCPLTAFDDDMNRLGMGGGYYDRFLPRCKNAVLAGVAFDVQRFHDIPADPHDIKMDMIITESGLRR